MIWSAIRTAMLALAFLCVLPAGADYAAGQQAWDAGRPDEARTQWRTAAPEGRHAAEADEVARCLRAATDEGMRFGCISPAGKKFRDCDECPEMVVVPSGSFLMGSPESEAGRYEEEGPRHRVTIPRPFAVGVHEVTRGEFGRFVSETGRSMGGSCWTYQDGEWEERTGGRNVLVVIGRIPDSVRRTRIRRCA